MEYFPLENLCSVLIRSTEEEVSLDESDTKKGHPKNLREV